MSTPQRHQRWIGQVIADRYQVRELLGEGGMGAVYIAEHLTLHKQVALKVVHPEHAGNAELAARFAREAMATSRIDHPNVISALDFGTLPDGTAFLAVQLVRGPSLTKVLSAEGALPWARAAELGAQVADALCAAHGYGIVHRDLKPDNILLQFLDDGGELVKVLDFGVAKFERDSLAPPPVRGDSQVTKMGIVIGTPGYMAPEQAIGHNADHRADLYALGVILWEAIVGRALWGDASDLQSLVERQLSQIPALLREASGDASIPDLLQDLVASLLARRAEDRPADATLVREQLRAIADLPAAQEQPRWRSGARRMAGTGEIAARSTPGSLGQRGRTPNPADKSLTPAAFAPTDPPPPMPQAQPAARASSLPPRARRYARTAWLLTLLVTSILGGVVFLVATGQIAVKPQGQIAEVAQSVAEQLNLPELKALTGEKTEPDTKTGLPARLEPAFERMIVAEEREERVSAANAVLGHLPLDEVPVYVRRMAYLQLAQTCAEKRDEIVKLGEIADPRALPLLVRLAQKPRTGCGKKHRDDCFACLRKPLDDLIDSLERKQAAATP